MRARAQLPRTTVVCSADEAALRRRDPCRQQPLQQAPAPPARGTLRQAPALRHLPGTHVTDREGGVARFATVGSSARPRRRALPRVRPRSPGVPPPSTLPTSAPRTYARRPGSERPAQRDPRPTRALEQLHQGFHFRKLKFIGGHR
jgi:hypothetical protein